MNKDELMWEFNRRIAEEQEARDEGLPAKEPIIDEEEMIRYIEQDTMINKLYIQKVIDSYDRYLYSKGLIED